LEGGGNARHSMRIKLALGDYLRLYQPLPWDVLNAQGLLLLNKGAIPRNRRQLDALIEYGAYVDQYDYEHHRRQRLEQAARAETFNPMEPWEDLRRRFGQMLRRPEDDMPFTQRILSVAKEVLDLIDRDADLAIFAMMQLEQPNYAVAHALQTAAACGVYSGFMQMFMEERITLVNAALTMNIGMLELQQALSQQAEPPSPRQRQQIDSHPLRSRQMLEDAGVRDEDWLRIVMEHHENGGGQGYPSHTADVSPSAEVLNITDRYLAKMSQRRRRSAMTPDRAARDLFMFTTGHHKDIVTRLIKVFGLYPPGNLVKLCNGEVAMVLRRGTHASKPQVSSIMSAFGVPLVRPVPRDTAEPEFAVRHVFGERGITAPLDFAKLFGPGKAD
jgi:HD-GYP domain-containing protein (c-di-GMP phosphodiesterase class II)